MLFNSFAVYIKANNLKTTLYNKINVIFIASRLPSGFTISKGKNELQVFMLTNDTKVVSLTKKLI